MVTVSIRAEQTPCTQKGEPSGAPGEADVIHDSETKMFDWAGIVARIGNRETAAIEELYAILVKGIRYYLNRQLGPQELDDKVHDTFLIVVHAIQRSEVREPERLIGFVRMIVRRQVSLYLPHMVEGPLDGLEIGPGDTVPDRGRNPEQHSAAPQKVAIAKGVLEQLSGGDREILVRFYVREEPPEQICREMGLTETQFRLAKARAKAQFGELERSSGTRACHFS